MNHIDSANFQLLKMEVHRRVVPGLRHNMLGKLQPIALLSQILSKKLDIGNVDLDYIKTQTDEIKLNAKLLTTATQNLFSWMEDEQLQLPAEVLVKECLELLKMECYSKHLQVSNHVTSSHLLSAQLARVVVCTVMIVLADKTCEDKSLDISMTDETLQFTWNQACEAADSSHPGRLANWDWIHDFDGAQCQISMIKYGMRVHFPASSNEM
ncbi:hypothetical protein [Methylophilus sp. 3sh_L]|uniref:hypothetical protein n=1 Tax=Methylophilus sp. 3sh_L TaxID=3377114 RepID=UPI00398E4D15